MRVSMTALISSTAGIFFFFFCWPGQWKTPSFPSGSDVEATHQPTLPQMTQIQRFEGLWQVEHFESLVSDVIVLRR